MRLFSLREEYAFSRNARTKSYDGLCSRRSVDYAFGQFIRNCIIACIFQRKRMDGIFTRSGIDNIISTDNYVLHPNKMFLADLKQ